MGRALPLPADAQQWRRLCEAGRRTMTAVAHSACCPLSAGL